MRSELFVALSATVSLFPGVEGDVRFKIGFLSETLSTECAQECLFHLHVFVDLCLGLKVQVVFVIPTPCDFSALRL